MSGDVGAKVRYVLGQGQTRDHRCHWPGCQEQVPPAKWGCRKHWYMLPEDLRAEIWRTFQPGQEINATPSREYVAVARRVQEWIRQREQPAPATDWKDSQTTDHETAWNVVERNIGGRPFAPAPAASGTKVMQCPKCKGMRMRYTETVGPHSPHAGQGPPGYGPAMVDCVGDLIDPWPWPEGKNWP